jgi:hypothetical protein
MAAALTELTALPGWQLAWLKAGSLVADSAWIEETNADD